MITHTMQAFDEDLHKLLRKLVDMIEMDATQIRAATDALVRHDATVAAQVIDLDAKIDEMQRDVEEEAITVIARRQPMAVDLREIVGALRIASDLERIGDFAENIAKRVLLMDDLRIPQVMPRFRHMAQLALDQLTKVMQSYVDRDAARAVDVWQCDQEIDAFNLSLFRELLTHMLESPVNITYCIHFLFCAKNLERIGDHITNIAETIYYIVEGHRISGQRPKADLTSKDQLPLPV
jgi:phosphate transport system protein